MPGASGVLLLEVCGPLLLLCWVCCTGDDGSEAASDGRHPASPLVTPAPVQAGGRRPSTEQRRARGSGGGGGSLRLPACSGEAKHPVHRSHEQLSQPVPGASPAARYERHRSAPSVIHEVLHRRDWEHSARELRESPSPESVVARDPPLAVPESSSTEDVIKDEGGKTKACKKHHTNIKSSNHKKLKEKESFRSDDIKDEDVTENNNIANFYIGDQNKDTEVCSKSKDISTCGGTEIASNDFVIEISKVYKPEESKAKSLYKAKDAKQSFNESVKCKKSLVRVEEYIESMEFKSYDEGVDRSGAVHHSEESRESLVSVKPRMYYPSPSVEPAGYESGAVYLSQPADGVPSGPSGARHASEGDILGSALRPQSGAFSDSDVDLQPAYSTLHTLNKETAI